jgi:hypothetical protein
MKKYRILFFPIFICITGSLWLTAAYSGQSSTNYTVQTSVLGSGGPSESSNYQIHTVIGDSVSGRASSSNYKVSIGFLYMLVDTDGDGILNDFEDLNHNGIFDAGETNPGDLDTDDDGISDGIEDADKDGVLDAGETDPRDSDTDNDGMPDGWEESYDGFDPLVNDASGDFDHDGYTNYEEFTLGSDPLNRNDPRTRAMPWLQLLLE